MAKTRARTQRAPRKQAPQLRRDATTPRKEATTPRKEATTPRPEATPPRPEATTPRKEAKNAEPTKISLRARGSKSVEWSVTPALAMRWSSAVLNRRRWAGDEKSSARQSLAAAEALPRDLRDWLDSLGGEGFDGLVEVHVEHESERQSWPARLFPWEYVLTAARKRNEFPMTVMRSISTDAKTVRRSSNGVVLYIESAPAGLRAEYGFDNERTLVCRALGIPDDAVREWRGAPRRAAARAGGRTLVVLDDPDRAELEAAVRALAPEIVHVTGFDTHQGFAMLAELSKERVKKSRTKATECLSKDDEPCDDVAPRTALDGYLIRAGVEPVALPAEALANSLCAASQKPRLVCFNLFNSGSRSAALTVAAGAEAAIGFLDDFDDSLTERLFADLYTAWRHKPGESVSAFRWAFDEQRRFRGALRGTSVVFWVADRIVEAKGTSARKQVEGLRALSASVGKARDVFLEVDENLPSILQVDIEHREAINYSLLHNDRPLFEKFDLIKHADGTLRGVELEVLLHLGPDSAPFRRSLDLVDRVTPLKNEIRVPLTSTLARAVRESVRTSLYVRVAAQGRTLLSRTYPVSLLSANEWRDTDEDRIWLPSFVLPRDPAVSRIVDSAQRYLMAISDDPTMGFDGYQSVDDGADDPYALVDAQVRALWSALIHEHALGYINPPPTYTESSQRIRTPSEILGGRRGTCIDLALLLAACLEYVEIYPAIFLLEGHCFPGYWRSEADHEEFVLARDSLDRDGSKAAVAADADEQQRLRGAKSHYGWYFDRPFFDEIKRWVRKGSLVPLEAVWLTTREGFAASQDAGEENLRSKREFDSMLDVLRARAAAVTPLPIREELA
jgi:hypothetical protein